MAAKRRELEDRADSWRREFELPGDHFSVAVDEALLFANSERVMNDFLRDGGDKLVGYLLKIEDAEQTIAKAFAAVLSREPDEAEVSAFREYLAQRRDKRVGRAAKSGLGVDHQPGTQIQHTDL
jgi:hypothetical protein